MNDTTNTYQFPESEAVVDDITAIRYPAYNFIDGDFIDRLYAWSLQAYGPGERTAGIIDHIKKELGEIRKDPTDLEEWIDVILLALNGAQRLGVGGEAILEALFKKCKKNCMRTWPDWRGLDPNKAIEHDRSYDSGIKTQQEILEQNHLDNPCTS